MPAIKHEVRIKKMNLLVSKRCNLRCRMCDYREGNFLHKEMSAETIKNLISEACELGLEELTFSGGEPMVNKNIFDIILHSKKMNVNTTLLSNGTLIGEKEAEKLVDCGINSIVVSLEGFEELNDHIRGQGNFKKAINALKHLKKYENQLNVIKVGVTISKYNYDKIFDFTKYLFEDIGINSISYNPFDKVMLNDRNYAERKDEFDIKPEMIGRLEEELNKVIEYKNVNKRDYPTEKYLRKIPDYFLEKSMVPETGCDIPCTSCAVYCNGSISACHPEGIVGNYQQNSLKEIIQSEKYQEVCERAVNGKCVGCLCACYSEIHD